MKTLAIVTGALLITLLLACDDLVQVQDEGGPAATPMSPATPEQPREAEESNTSPSTPKPAATSAPANTPLSVMTPLAVLPSYTPQPTATSSPAPTATPVSPEEVQAKAAENVQRCKHWALLNMQPIEYSKFEKLDPYTMSDLERVLWGSVIVQKESVEYAGSFVGVSNDNPYRFSDSHVEWCQDYWSEPLGPENANKRNHEAFRVECVIRLVKGGTGRERSAKKEFSNHGPNGMSPVIVNQWVRLLNWMEIGGGELLEFEEKPFDLVSKVWEKEWDSYSEGRYKSANTVDGYIPLASVPMEDIEWWGIESVWAYDQLRYCQSYYPQLFFGRWVPLDDFGMDERLEEAQDKLNKARKSYDWPDWAEGPDRDIIIRLE